MITFNRVYIREAVSPLIGRADGEAAPYVNVFVSLSQNRRLQYFIELGYQDHQSISRFVV